MNNKLISKYKLKGNPRLGLTAATWGFFIGFAAVALYGPAAKEFKTIMQLSGMQVGLLVAAPMLTGSLMRIPFGAWVDKVGGKKPLSILLALGIIGMIGLAGILFLLYPNKLTANYYPLILLFGFLSGCGIATFSVGIPQASYWYPQSKQGIVLGLYGGLGNTAPGIFTVLLSFILPVLGLATSYLIWLIVLIIGSLIYLAIAHDAYFFQLTKKGVNPEKAEVVSKKLGQELIPSGKVMESLKISASVWRTWALVALYFTSFGGFLALTAWFPTYWSIFHGFGIREAGLLGGVGFSLLASFIRIYGGTLSDKVGGEKVATGSFSLVLIGAILLTIFTAFLPDFIGELFIGAGMGMGNAAVFKLVPKYVPESVGGAAGWVGGLGAFGGFAVPPILGFFVDKMGTIGYARGFMVYIVLAVISIFIAYILKTLSKVKVTN